jgi:adenosylcobinamide-GDP ribazoletransferase
MRVALSFLTRLPVGRLDVDDYFRALGRQVPLFPLVGLAVGAVALTADAAAGLLFGWPVRSAVAVLAGVWVTGALHLDGLMDTADGVGSNRSRERMLEIMKDSRVGAMGAVAGTADLLLRFALLMELAGGLRWRALLLAPALGRMAMAVAAGAFPPAGAGAGPGGGGPGLGASFAAHVGPWQVAGALAVGLALAAGADPVRGPAAWALALAGAWLAGRALTARLGGLTGDTYGAVCELAELTALAVLAAVWRAPW